jgi:hypothetical protein
MISSAVSHKNSVYTIIEAMRVFGYINEQQYSELNTTFQQQTHAPSVRQDGAETIELARNPDKVLPGEY